MLNKGIRGKFTAISVFALVAFICAILFSSYNINSKMESHCFTRLETTSKLLSTELKKSVETDQIILNVIGENMAGRGFLNADKIFAAIKTFRSQYSLVTDVQYLDSENRLYCQDGTVKDMKGVLDMAQQAAEGSVISDKTTDFLDAGKPVFRHAVPVIKDGKPIGMLYGIVSLNSLPDKIDANIYDGKAYLYLEDGNTGDFLLDTWHMSLGNISDFSTREPKRGFDFQTVVSEMESGKTGRIAFHTHSTDETLYACYMPMGINNWNLFVVVSQDVALAEERSLVRIMNATTVIEILILILYVAFVVLSLIKTNHEVQRIGLQDHTTGLPNRNAYDKYLRENSDVLYPRIACIFIDANGLHEINNLYGHDAGDRFLGAVGDAVKTEFSSDCIFRSGGDEFVILYQGGDMALIREKAKRINEIVKNQHYSISYGIAVHENDRGLESVIYEADQRMLENKRRYYQSHKRRETDERDTHE